MSPEFADLNLDRIADDALADKEIERDVARALLIDLCGSNRRA
jgi:hypothetical protein